MCISNSYKVKLDTVKTSINGYPQGMSRWLLDREWPFLASLLTSTQSKTTSFLAFPFNMIVLSSSCILAECWVVDELARPRANSIFYLEKKNRAKASYTLSKYSEQLNFRKMLVFKEMGRMFQYVFTSCRISTLYRNKRNIDTTVSYNYCHS